MITRVSKFIFKHYFKIEKNILHNENAKIMFYTITYKDKFGREFEVSNFNIINGSMKDIINLFIEALEDVKRYNKANRMPGWERADTFMYNNFVIDKSYKLAILFPKSKKDLKFQKEYDKYLNEVKESLVFK